MGTLCIQINSNQTESSKILVSEEMGKPDYPEKNSSEQGREPANSVSPHVTCSPGIELETHWWEVSALTTAPTLLRMKTEVMRIKDMITQREFPR